MRPENLPTPWRYKFRNSLAGLLIAIGGISTIVALLLVVLVLFATTLPLLRKPQISRWQPVEIPGFQVLGLSQEATFVWGLADEQRVEVRYRANGDLLSAIELPHDSPITSTFLPPSEDILVLGFEDGQLQIVSFDLEEQLLAFESLPTSLQASLLKTDEVVWRQATYTRFGGDAARRRQVREIRVGRLLKIADAPIRAIDLRKEVERGTPIEQLTFGSRVTRALLVLCGEADNATNQLLHLQLAESNDPAAESELQRLCSLEVRNRQRSLPPKLMMIGGLPQALIQWPNGFIDRLAISAVPKLLETQTAVTGGERIICSAPLASARTLVCGTDRGRLLAWSLVSDSAASQLLSEDWQRLALTHELEIGQHPITSLYASQRDQVLFAGDDQGNLAVCDITTDRVLQKTAIQIDEREGLSPGPAVAGTPVSGLAVSSTSQLVIATMDEQICWAEMEMGHPQASAHGLFGRVWYEGYDRPRFIWQSSTGNGQSEIKLSLTPLLFGTLKASLMAMLVAIPLGVGGAIYSSEFLPARRRNAVKPLIELMASFPTVVIGYVAATVIGPMLHQHLIELYFVCCLTPLCLWLGGHRWRPTRVAAWLSRNRTSTPNQIDRQDARLIGVIAWLVLSVVLCGFLGRIFEQLFLRADFATWLNSRALAGSPVWFLAVLPGFLLTFVAIHWRLWQYNSYARLVSVVTTPSVRLILLVILAASSAMLTAMGLEHFGWDSRDILFTSFQNQNSLLVGIALGFCVTPIVFSVADETMQCVPHSLRQASYSCGASSWQTTASVVIPAAATGLISAVVIGFGRAVGETMIVLMVVGNTPVMEWNPFSGLRALTATLAVELPEAVSGSTHFRTLFLAALMLFCFTLVTNTLAEVVRDRLRKRMQAL